VTSHSQRTQHGPSRLSIIVGWGLVGLDIGLVARILTRDDLDEGHLIGAGLGIVLGALLVAQTMGRVGDRMLAQDRIRRARERQEREDQRQREEQARHVGTWTGQGPGQVLKVRHDPATGLFYVTGWLGDFSSLGAGELPHPDPFALGDAITELEKTGELAPASDEGTRAVRARLDLPGWDTGHVEVAAPDEPRTEVLDAIAADLDLDPGKFPVGDTQRIEWTDAGLPRRPVGETLRPINTAVFRTEAERADWFDRTED
jgi:hypothetical protein